MINALVYMGGLLQVAALLYLVACMLCFLFGGWYKVNGGSDRVYNISVKMFKAVGFLRLCKAVESQESRIERGLEVTTHLAGKAVTGLQYALIIGLILLGVAFIIKALGLQTTAALLIGCIVYITIK